MGRLWWPGIRPLEPVGSVHRFIKSWILIFLHTCVCVCGIIKGYILQRVGRDGGGHVIRAA